MQAVPAVAVPRLQYKLEMRSFCFILVLVLSCGWASAQTAAKKSVPKPVNQTDAKGKRHGTWVISQPARMGEPSASEFGEYEHGDKTGLWYKMDEESNLLSIETYKNNVLDGEAKYYDKGRLICIGHYRGLNPSRANDTFMVENQVTGVQTLRVIPTERGTMRHGSWAYYDADNGRMTREEDYQVDELVYRQEYAFSKEDSLDAAKRDKFLPHNKKPIYQPPTTKRVSYMN